MKFQKNVTYFFSIALLISAIFLSTSLTRTEGLLSDDDCEVGDWETGVISSTDITSYIYAEKIGIYCNRMPVSRELVTIKTTPYSTNHYAIYRKMGPLTHRIATHGPTKGYEMDLDDVAVIDIPDGDPTTIALVTVRVGGSNIWLKLEAMDLTIWGLESTSSINYPLNKYQATNREGAEDEIAGFYLSQSGEVLLDVLVDQEVNGSDCNECFESYVATMVFLNGEFIEVNRVPYDIETYTPLADLI